MAIVSFRAGPPTILFPQPNTTALPSLAAVQASGTAATLTDVYYNSLQTKLTQGVAYTCAVALVGQDNTTSGYSFTPASLATSAVTLSGTQNAIEVSIPFGSWPANFNLAGFVAIFIAGPSGAYQLCKCVPLTQFDLSNTFKTFVWMLPLSACTQFTFTQLQSTVRNTTILDLGDRAPTGYSYVAIQPTTNEINVDYVQGGQVTFKPNNSADFNVLTSRPVSVSFQSMLNDVKSVVKATAGDFGQGTDTNVFTEASQAINTAQVSVQGNRPLILQMPPDPTTGVGEYVLFTSLLLQNQEEVNMAWSKNDQTPTPFKFQPASVDASMNNQPTVFMRSVK